MVERPKVKDVKMVKLFLTVTPLQSDLFKKR